MGAGIARTSLYFETSVAFYLYFGILSNVTTVTIKIMDINKFLLLVPQLPSSPSSPRVKIWRDLRAAGAISLQNGIWILPYTPEYEKFMQAILSYVEKNNGSANLLVTDTISSTEHDKIIHQFHQDRHEEYEEFIEHCEEFLGELNREIAKQKFTYAELEESENNLKRLKKWIKNIRARDHLEEAIYPQAQQLLEQCETTLEEFTQQIYAQESLLE